MYVLTADFQKPDAAEIFTRSLKETGFGVIKNHPIDYQLVKEVYAEWESFFNLSEAEKNKYLFDKKDQDGFFPKNISETAKGYSVKDIKEFYHFYPWGRRPSVISPKTLQLYKEMSALAGTLLGWVEAHTPENIRKNFSMPLSEMIKDAPRTLLRILHYPPLEGTEEEGAVRAAAHEDINLITLLPAATATGLQVKDVQGNWHDVECEPGTVVINTGDMLQECTEHYYKATTHQVINPSGEAAKTSRFSMPLFLHPWDTVKLSERHTAGSYWIERLKELGVM